MAEPSFWDDHEQAKNIGQKRMEIINRLDKWEDLYKRLEEMDLMIEMAIEEGDESLEGDLKNDFQNLVNEFEKAEIDALLSDKYDSNNAILSIHPGAGGTESQDWAEMLLRMYTRWAENQGYSIETLDFLPGDEGGVKSVTLLICGVNAYGYLKCEKGVHRLVRISPFDSANRRHTSFASVSIVPEIDDDVDIKLDQSEIRIETFRAGGAGGQHVNKTDSAVRIIHEPTGIIAQCQNERSQHKNKATAMKLLRGRLLELSLLEQEKKKEELRGEEAEIAWGNQIRSYVFHPYNMVKDHRTNVEEGNVKAVMDGHLSKFIQAYLRKEFLKETNA